MGHVRRLLAFTVVIFGVAASPAKAFDWCVGEQREGCSGSVASVQDALWGAAGNPGPDRVLIGHGDFVVPSGGLVYDSPNRVEIRGISGTETRLLQANETPSTENALRVSDSASGESVIADLGIVVGQKNPSGPGFIDNAALMLGQNTLVEDVVVRAAPGVGRARGLVLEGQTTVTGVDVDLGFGPNGTVALAAEDPGAVVTVEDSSLRGALAIEALRGAAATVRRVDTEASFECVAAFSATVDAENVVCGLDPLTGANSYAFAAGVGGGGTANDMIVRNATVTGGDERSYGAYSQANSAGGGDLTITDSILRVPNHTLGRHASDALPANLVAEHNDFDPDATVGDNSGPGTLTNTGARTDDPRFLGDPALGELRLRHDSPLIDAGNPASVAGATTDVNGDERVRDGNGDGAARVDLGAFEYQRRAPAVPAVSATPLSAAVGTPFAFTASALDPDGDPLTYLWSFDDGGPGDGASVAHAFGAPGRHTTTVSVTDPTGLGASAQAAVDVVPAPADPPPPPPVVPPDVVAPRFSILRRGLRLSRTGTIPVRVTCSAAEREPCAGTLTLASSKRVAPGRKILQLGRGAFSVAPGRTAIVRVQASKRNAKIARRLRKVKVTAVAVARDAAGNQATARRTATLITATPRRKPAR